jgi:hypothetical protein
MMAVLGVLTRRAFAVPFEVRRLVHAIVVLAGVAVAGDLLLPEAGVVGFLTRALALAAIPALLLVSRFAYPEETAFVREQVRRRRAAR